MNADIVIRNGTLIDGTGAPARPADVVIADGRVARIVERAEADRPPEPVHGAREIDAAGLVVAPGFIDVHTHDDVAFLTNPGMDFKVMQGVTTCIAGNCGAGAAPANERFREAFERGWAAVLGGSVDDWRWETCGEFYDAVAQAGISVNAAFLVPHGVLRFVAMGAERRTPTAEELADMRRRLDEAMRAGALGLSTGLIYAPGRYAATEELIALARVVAEYDGVYASHIRNEADGVLDAMEEAFRIGREAGVPVQISHHKAALRHNFGRTRESLALLDQRRAEGIDAHIDMYPYTGSSGPLAAYLFEGLTPEMAQDWMIASVETHHEYEGRRLSDIAVEMGVTPYEAGRRLVEMERGGVVAILFIMDENDLRRVFAHETCMGGSDGIPSRTGKPHPRLYGTFPRLLARYVREERLVPIEAAVRKLSALPARKFRLKDRGELREGCWADVTVFDSDTIADTATYEDPRRYPRGIEYVIVNGRVVVDRGRHTGVPAGQVLRRGV
ncbi:MAG TPA: D-aminoacylase [Dehalococcoidia bacterium]|nr:D-aminoacylase [Dehalococcoidia bacterium]